MALHKGIDIDNINTKWNWIYVRAFTRKAQYYGNSWYSSIKVL
jgi:hypothetical protein